MSDQVPKQCYVYQPHAVSRKDGRLWAVGGLPTAMPREWAEAVVEAINDIAWLMERCHACGHRLAFASMDCPQCGADSIAPWFTPSEFPELCKCEWCQKAREERTNV